MKVAVAFDHRGTKLRERVLEDLASLGHESIDLGTDKTEPKIDYPDKALELGRFIGGGRYARRLEKVAAIERGELALDEATQ